MKITHWGISYFRSIGENPVMLDLTKKINVLVGANNSGKSNVLRALIAHNANSDFQPVEHHLRQNENSPQFHFWADIPPKNVSAFGELGVLKVSFAKRRNSGPFVTATNLASLEWNTVVNLIHHYTSTYFHQVLTGEDRARQEGEVALRTLGNITEKLGKTGLIPQFREIRGGDAYAISGTGVVKLLARWHHPEIGADAERDKFERVQSLLRRLLNMSSVTLEVSHKQDEVIIGRDGLRLPLNSYGTGIHELIILAIAVLSFDNAIVCIEEPEIHLHPLLQRRFVQFLREETSNRYVITTHSPALIAPDEDTAVTHLWLDEKDVTQSRPIATSADSLRALHDLGAQASDLLQANSVIWVEGPSDRTYLNRWLELLHPGEFREGVAYSVMFYGGRLLSHLSMERDEAVETPEDEAAELIQLLRINQHSAILIDSDRSKAGAALNRTKQRIESECAKSDVFCWITPGREIENALPAAAINAVYSELSKEPVTVKLKPYQKIEDALKTALKPTWPREHYYDHAKAQFAHKISEHLTAASLPAEVRALVDQLVKVIRHQPL